VDEGNAENYNDGSNNSSDIDNNDFGDGNGSDSDKGNEAYRCVGRRDSLAPVGGGLKLKHTIKRYLQRYYLPSLIPSIYISDRSTALSSNYCKRARSPIYNRLYA